jgi:monoamine oxidase
MPRLFLRIGGSSSGMGNADFLVLGAGAAGLTAATELARAGLGVTLLEARDRVGGRMFTRHDIAGNPVELGAEFIHGRAPEIWEIIDRHGIPTREVSGEPWCVSNNQLRFCDFFSDVDDLLAQMNEQEPDESFLDFLSRHPQVDPQIRKHTVSFVSGFNAADPALVSVHWLVQSRRAEESIHGDRAFRMQGGYATLVDILHRQAEEAGVTIRLNTIAEEVRWSPRRVEIIASAENDRVAIAAAGALVTLPLGVLQAKPGAPGAIQFSPELPAEKRQALTMLEMGAVIRASLRFRERFWDDLHPLPSQSLAQMGFLFTGNETFPTWWTAMPEKWPLINGWAPFRAAQQLSGQSSLLVLESALDALGNVLGVARERLDDWVEAAYTHDWQSDPFSRGAYSYVRKEGEYGPAMLAAPIEGTLFFAGEATDISGNNGTVHGALASGLRAAKEALATVSRV